MSVDPAFAAADAVERWRRLDVEESPDETTVITVLEENNPQTLRFQSRYQEILEEKLAELLNNIRDTGEELKSGQKGVVELGELVHDEQVMLSKVRKDINQQEEDMKRLLKDREEEELLLQNLKSDCEATCQQLAVARALVQKAKQEDDEGNKLLYLIQLEEAKVDERTNAAKRAAEKSEKEQAEREREKLRQDLHAARHSNKMDSLREDVGLLDAQIIVQKATNAHLRELLIKSMAECDSLQVETRRIHRQWNQAVNWLRLRDEKLDILQKALEEQHQHLLTLKAQLLGARKAIAMEQAELEKKTTTLNKIEHVIKADQKLIAMCNDELNRSRIEYSELMRIMRDIEEQISYTGAEKTRLKITHDALYETIEKQFEKKNKIKDEIFETNVTIEIVEQNAKFGKNLVLKKRNLVKGMEKLMVEEDNQLANLELLIISQQSRLDKENATCEHLREKAESVLQAIADTEVYIERMMKKVTDNYKTVNNINAELFILIEKSGQQEISPQDLEIMNLEKDIGNVRNENQDLKIEWIRMQEDLETLITKREHCREENDMANKELEVSSTRMTRLTLEINDHKARVRELDVSIRRDQDLRLALNMQLRECSDQQKQNEEDHFIQNLNNSAYISEAEQELIAMRVKTDTLVNERDRLLDTKPDAERQILFYEGKIKAAEEILELLNNTMKNDIADMKAEMHRMELRLHHIELEEQQKSQLLVRAASIHADLERRADRQKGKGASAVALKTLSRDIKSLKRKVTERCNDVMKTDEHVKELSDRLQYKRELEISAKEGLKQLINALEVADGRLSDLMSEKRKGLVDLIHGQRKHCWYEKISMAKYKKAEPDTGKREEEARKLCRKIGTLGKIVEMLMRRFPQAKDELQKSLDCFGTCVGPLPVPRRVPVSKSPDPKIPVPTGK